MDIPSDSHMEAYLKHLGIRTGKSNIKSEYLRSIYKVLPRKKALRMTTRQARRQTMIQPGIKSET
ncbi:hypothetical protein GZ77_05460 [Endozoicomonas montiporae]|uniref:Uncharacterized protein n=2 Tax=Endozoicomonas montiporae TaxID=1027273 RepID=A0A081NBW4_9GAMM|nr:hypothetical protein [Endozoicomonas montiporae]AMO56254.1 hypothetical protein EZMO1_2142 [Endozoicomonas montiporae CL-33]KEQ15937.1 hypothetical protein GZ77_05460 [Endozoicomonas montiporae]